ncbi:MAG: hypothetical protein JW702_10460 [Clostridiales bacterium]|nr:hypothetical protein [Clostridiales bacterium]
MIEKKMEIGNLYAFYGKLLTENQRQMIELYIYEDLSLGEISQNLNISRQAVYDSVKRSEKTLQNFEEKLSLIQKFETHKKELREMSLEIELLKTKLIDKNHDQFLDNIIERMNQLIID